MLHFGRAGDSMSTTHGSSLDALLAWGLGPVAPAVGAGTVVSQALSSEAWRHLQGLGSSHSPTHIEQSLVSGP